MEKNEGVLIFESMIKNVFKKDKVELKNYEMREEKEMEFTIDNLEKCFEGAKEQNANYIAVKVKL